MNDKKHSLLQSILKNKVILFILTIGILQLKTMIFFWIWNTQGSTTIQIKNLYMDWEKLVVHIGFVLVISSFIFLFKERGRIIFLLIIDFLVSLLFEISLLYFRNYSNFLSLRQLIHRELFNPLNKSFIAAIDKVDICLFFNFLVIIPLAIIFLKVYRVNKQNRPVWAFILSIGIGIGSLYTIYFYTDIKDATNGKFTMFTRGFVPEFTMTPLGPLGYYYYDIHTCLTEDKKLTDEELIDINKWFDNNQENLPDNKYKGILKDKNLIVIQWESLEQFIVGARLDGQELTPNLNKLLKTSLYFNNIYEQNYSGTTADAEHMANNSLFPLREGVYFNLYPYKKYNSLQRILKDKGYKNVSSQGEVAGNWNWLESHIGLGSDEQWDIDSYNTEGRNFYGLYDQDFLPQLEKKIENVPEPFYSFATTLTSHGPYDMVPDEEKELKIPDEIKGTYLSGYFESVRYTDKYLGVFLDKLKEGGLLDKSIVVVYGDHGGINKYYKDALKDIDFEGRWWSQDSLKVPLLISNPSIKGETIETLGGLTDFIPTIGYVMDLNKDEYNYTAMGRNLFNTERNATITGYGKLQGDMTEDEKQHLEDAFKISDLIAKSDYIDKYRKKLKDK